MSPVSQQTVPAHIVSGSSRLQEPEGHSTGQFMPEHEHEPPLLSSTVMPKHPVPVSQVISRQDPAPPRIACACRQARSSLQVRRTFFVALRSKVACWQEPPLAAVPSVSQLMQWSSPVKVKPGDNPQLICPSQKRSSVVKQTGFLEDSKDGDSHRLWANCH